MKILVTTVLVLVLINRASAVPVIHVIDIYLPEDVNTTGTYIVWPINSTDLDGDENATFGIVSQSNTYTFEISDNAIVTSATFDFETTKNYTVVINATDTSTFESSTATLTVYITDVNDNDPTFTSGTSLLVLETANIGDVLYNATTEDKDTVGNVTYTLLDGNRNSDFAIGPSSGALTLQNKLDPQNETELVYDLVIEANDSVNTAYLNLTVNVKTAPILDIINASITENTNTSGPYELWNITWSDLDGDLNPTVEIAVESVPGTFQIINDSVLVTSAEFDYENTTSYTVTMIITDVHGLTSNNTLPLYVTDENDVTPVFVTDSTLDISEKIAIGSVVYAANVTDPDTNPSIQYVITDGNTDGFFSINLTDGTVTLEKEFNSTTSLEFNLTLQANDTVNVGELILTVNVITVPVINAFKINITENSEPGIVWNLTSSDRDGDVDPVYVIVNQSNAGIFEINYANTSVITNTSFDYESQTMYTFEVEATDKSSLKLSSTATFTVSVVDENDVTPEFTSNAVVQLQEDTPLNTIVYIANATDEDTVGSTSYSIIGGNDNIFEIDDVSGNITLITVLNASATLTHLLTLQANDTVNVATFNVTFTLSTAPVMVIPKQVTVVEGVSIGSDVVTLNSTDLNGDTDPVYEIINQSVPGTFKINENNTKLVTNVSIDYESVKNFTVTVRVTDTSPFGKSSTSEFTVSVVDANDETPVFTSANSTDIPETTNIETVIYTATTEDIDTIGTVSYAIIDGNPNSVFDINADNGSVTLKSALSPTTVENVTYNLVIQANDSVNTATLNFTVSVKTAPAVHVVDINLREDVNTTGTYTVWAINSTDADGDEDTTFTIVSQSSPDTFEISTENAIVTNTSFDFEITKNYTIVINATDSSIFQLSSTVTLTIFITDVNDVTPTFTSDTSLVVLQTTALGTILYNASAEDIDTVGNMTYTITDGNRNNDFSIDPITGELTLQNNLDPQAVSDVVYSLVIEANDTKNTAYLNLTVDVKTVPYLNVTDMNVTENTDTSGPFNVWTIEWIDLDGDKNHTFAVVNESVPGTFEITNGVLETNVTLDYETVKNYTATISITDEHGLSSADTITLSILDQNDVTPMFTSNNTLDLSEETKLGVVVYTVSTIDPDTVGMIEYSTTDLKFSLNASTGVLTLDNALDFETTPSFSVEITANDSINVATFNLTVNVKTMPVINAFQINITENNEPGAVWNLTSSDRDGDVDPVYFVVNQSDAGIFDINDANTSVITNTSFDFESHTIYTFEVEVTDKSSLKLSSTATFTVSVVDENDVTPEFTSSARVQLQEDTPLNTIVYIANTTDKDTVGSTSYTIIDGNDNIFEIDDVSGNVTLITALNASATLTHVLTLQANDTVNVATFNVTFALITAPVMVIPDQVTVVEGVSIGSDIITLNSTGLDGDIDPVYEIINQSVPGAFKINENNTKLVTNVSIDYESVKNFTVTVRVTDTSPFGKSSTSEFTVSVVDANDETPVFTSANSTEIPESTNIESVIYTATTEDIDTIGTVFYAIIDGDPNSVFEINTDNGSVTLKSALSPTTVENVTYNLVIQANDSVNTATLNFTVSVKTAPVVHAVDINLREDVNTTGTYTVWAINSTDADGDEDTTFTIVSQSSPDTFEISTENAIVTNTSFDFEITKNYTVVINATDSSVFQLSSTVTLTVFITDVNDVMPTFTSDTSLVVLQTTELGTILYNATTEDIDTVGNVTYTITDGNRNNDFSIDPITGELTLQNNLDPQMVSDVVYSLVIEANDTKNTAYLNLTVDVKTVPYLIVTDINVTENTDTSGPFHVWTIEWIDLDGDENHTFAIVNESAPGTFEITNEILVTNVTLDYEAVENYTATISITDVHGLSSAATITLSVLDQNDVTPMFTSNNTLDLSKETKIGAVVYTVSTTDPDTVGIIEYSTMEIIFSLNASTGVLTLDNALDFETTPSFSVEITANDSVNVATFNLTVNVKTMPVINAFQINITENNEPGVVWNLTSSDRDGDVDPVYFVVNQSDAGIFDINDANTSVITNTSFDFELQTIYTFEVEVTDKSSLKLSSTATFTVSVVDENDVTPEFTSSAKVQLQEDTPLNTVVYIANTTDEDTVGSTSYLITGGNDNIFEIDDVSGNITLITALNASAKLTHVLTLQANDTVNVATFNVTFTLSTAPIMVIPDQVTVVEGVAIGSDVLTLNSAYLYGDTDLDYEIINQSVPKTFKINENNTKLVTNVSIDYESVKNFTVTVRVTDTSAIGKSSTSEFTVSVVDANDETPVFTSADSTDIPETTNIETVIYTATTEDVDTIGTVSYAIIDGNPNSVFDINADNGSVTLKSALSPTTVENVTYNLVIQANDSVNTATLNFTVNVKTAPVVHVVDINLREDVDTAGTYTVWAINSTDADGDENTTFTIVSQSSPDTFEISSDNAIVTNASFDFEITKNYTVVINATDSSVFQLSSTVTLTVFITDVNDVTPTFTSDTSLVVLQTTEIGTKLYNATTEDIDTVGNVTYTIIDGNRNNVFSIEPKTGGLTLQNNLEPQMESEVVYFLFIEANDTENTAYLNLTVDVKTVPYLIVTDMNVTENTDTSDPFHVWTIEWIDLDGDENHTFAIVNESAPGTFEITNGILVTNVTLDYEAVKNYTATISITDVHGLSSADTITLFVLDQNDVTPMFTSNDTLDLSEETETGAVVYTVSTTDPDTVGSIEYSIMDVIFNLNASTGDLTLAHALDFETTPSFTVKITANDSVNVATFNLTVNVKTRPDINFTGVNVEISENEDTSDFFVLLNLTSTDRDGDPNPQYDIISESVPGTFVINDDKLQTNASFDYEQLQSHSVNIRVTDSSLGLTSNDTLTVSVTDVNDNSPIILSPTTLELREDTPTGTLVYRVLAIDNDSIGNLSFSIKDGNTNNDFGIDADSGNVTLDNALNASAQISYSLGIEASDGMLTDTITLAVAVKTAPILVFPDSNVTLAEGTYAGLNFSVLTLNSTDLDNDPNPWNELVSQNVPGTFFLSEDNKQLLTSADFNYTALNIYEVTLRVTDSSDFNMTSSRTLTVYITDTNNLPPEFTSPSTLVIPENQATGSIVYTAVAVDKDIVGEISYFILSGNTNNDFDLDPESGNLTLVNALRPSDNLQYVLEIQANDTLNTATLELTVDVKSIPVIAGDNLTIVETTDTSGTYVVLELTSRDLDNDTDPGYTIIYQSVNGTFEITNGTLLTTTAIFDDETSYEIVVQ
ncbi:protocadherin Fat 4-like [Mercenaria mercenaria]|uniref:protocadherin Fat 4-like n=1 Tax=Mercenaria mercenaria TaxID=6596 RepID=UPI00234E4621|nr:protocadherin Fat 4-like [Mercenaria mercenaria]